MNYELVNMGAYNLHLIKTDYFKTITVEVDFRREVKKEEISYRTLLKEVLLNSNKDYPSERELIKESENLYDLKIQASTARMGNYANLSFKIRFLNDKYTEKNMNKESIAFLMNILFNPNINESSFKEDILTKCKAKIIKNIDTLKDNKLKYTIFKLLETTKDKPYSYNSYGYIEDIDNITGKSLYDYYKSVINDDLIDIFVVGDIDPIAIKEIMKTYFQARTFHKNKTNIIVPELTPVKNINSNIEESNANQSQLTLLCSINNLTDYERKYVLRVYNEILGGNSNSILFDTVREKNSYAYYINSDVKSYDNILIIYSGIEPHNSENVIKLIKKCLQDIAKGKIDEEHLNNAKQTLISSIKASLDSPAGIINTYYAKVLVNSDDVETRINNISKVSLNDIVNVASKIKLHTMYLLEGGKDEDN